MRLFNSTSMMFKSKMFVTRRSIAVAAIVFAFISFSVTGSVAFGPKPSGSSWRQCDENIDFLDKHRYETALDNCLINPETSLACIQFCLIGKQTRPHSSCVEKCQKSSKAPEFPTCQAICEAQYCRGCTGVPACVKECEGYQSPEFYNECYNVCQIALNTYPDTGAFTTCMSGSTSYHLVGCQKSGDSFAWGRCGQLASKLAISGSSAYNSYWTKCMDSKLAADMNPLSSKNQTNRK